MVGVTGDLNFVFISFAFFFFLLPSMFVIFMQRYLYYFRNKKKVKKCLTYEKWTTLRSANLVILKYS